MFSDYGAGPTTMAHRPPKPKVTKAKPTLMQQRLAAWKKNAAKYGEQGNYPVRNRMGYAAKPAVKPSTKPAGKKMSPEQRATIVANKVAAIAARREFKLKKIQALTDRKKMILDKKIELKRLALEAKRTGNKEDLDKYMAEYKANETALANTNAAITTTANTDSAPMQASAAPQVSAAPQSSGGDSAPPQQYTQSQAPSEDEFVQQQQEYYDNQEQYYSEPTNEEFNMDGREGYIPESSPYAEQYVPDEEQQSDVNAADAGYDANQQYNEDYSNNEAYNTDFNFDGIDDGFGGLGDELKALYDKNIKAPAGTYIKTKVVEYVDPNGQVQKKTVPDTGLSTPVMVGGAIALAGVAYLLLKRKRR